MNNLNYGVIGNCKSAALVSETGALEWCCLPEFNSSSVFAKILDNEIGGEFSVHNSHEYDITQNYIKNTNILRTRFSKGNDSFEIIDFMPRYHLDNGHYYCPPEIIRYVRLLSGKPVITIKYEPKLNYANGKTETILDPDYIKSFSTKGKYESIYLYTNLPLYAITEKKEIELDQDGYFLLSYNQKIIQESVDHIYLLYQRTKVYWMEWADRVLHINKYHEHIVRSALVLKILSFENTGAILAAITTSLPETIGEIRNWDYRFCWIRDAAMMIRILNHLGHSNEARRFLDFIIDITPAKDEKIQIMYGIRGEKELTEKILDHLSGYENSMPVRIGNDAYKQKQHDIYGVLMDIIYQDIAFYNKSIHICEELWTIVRSVVRSVEANWTEPDKGIWEIRSEAKHFTFSKVLCWVAVDRGVKIARLFKNKKYEGEWTRLKNRIRKDVLTNAWDESKQAFTQYYGSQDLDAANLLMETYDFIDTHDPKYISTVKQTWKELSHKGLMFRYKNEDDFGTPSSSFTICNFWMARSLYLIGEKDEAEKLFKRVLQCSNHVGLLSEDIHFESHRLLGNFPQGYSHLSLIETALMMSNDGTNNNELLSSICR